jgi:hypothetical protein
MSSCYYAQLIRHRQSLHFLPIAFSQHILKDRRWHLILLDVHAFREADCNIDHYLIFGKDKEALSVGKSSAKKFNMGRFILNKVDE